MAKELIDIRKLEDGETNKILCLCQMNVIVHAQRTAWAGERKRIKWKIGKFKLFFNP